MGFDIAAALEAGGLLGGDIGAAAATDAAVAGAADIGAGAGFAADVGLGADATGLLGPAVGADIGGGALAADAGGALGAGVGADLLGGTAGLDLAGLGGGLGAVGGDIGALGGSLGGASPGLAADVAIMTPGATALGGTTAALPATGGGAFGAGQALEAAADPSTITDLAGSGTQFAGLETTTDVPVTDIGFTGLDPPTNLGGGGGGAAGADLGSSLAGAGIPGNTGPAGLPGTLPNSFSGGGVGANLQGWPGAAAAPAAGGGLGPATAGAVGDIGSSMDTALTAMGPEQLAGGPGAAGGGGGLMSSLGLSNRDLLMGGLALGPLAYTMMKGESPVPPQANQATALSPQEQALASQMMTSVQQNRPTPSQAAVIAQNTQQSINQARQQLFNMGIQNPEADSRWPAIMQQIQQQQLVQTQQFMAQNMNIAMAAAGPAQQGLLSVAQLQAQQDQAYTTALSNALRSAGTTLALGGFGGGKPANVNYSPLSVSV